MYQTRPVKAIKTKLPLKLRRQFQARLNHSTANHPPHTAPKSHPTITANTLSNICRRIRTFRRPSPTQYFTQNHV